MAETMTNCDCCCSEIACDEVQKCNTCGRDGLCPECLNDPMRHGCDDDEVDPDA